MTLIDFGEELIKRLPREYHGKKSKKKQKLWKDFREYYFNNFLKQENGESFLIYL